jgi:uncharacterized delta-60 repeat protein
VAAPGIVDMTFGNAGRMFVDSDAQFGGATRVLTTPDDSFFLIGSCQRAVGNVLCVSKHAENGGLDLTFGSGGRTEVAYPFGDSNVFSAALMPDGRLVVATKCYSPTGAEVCIWRFLRSGMLDSSFNQNGTPGYYQLNRGAVIYGIEIAALQNGEVVVSVSTGTNPVCSIAANACLVKFTEAGSVDTSFGGGPGGVNFSAPLDFYLPTGFASMFDYGQNKIVMGSPCYSIAPTPAQAYCVARMNYDGTLDATFGTGGWVAISQQFTGQDAQLAKMSLDRLGRLVIAGGCVAADVHHYCVARLNTNGARDETFGNLQSSFFRLSAPFPDRAFFEGFAVEAGGDVVAFGSCSGNGDECAARISSRGQDVSAYGGAGVGYARNWFDRSTAKSLDIVMQRSGNALIVGGCVAQQASIGRTVPCAARLLGRPSSAQSCSLNFDDTQQLRRRPMGDSAFVISSAFVATR